LLYHFGAARDRTRRTVVCDALAGRCPRLFKPIRAARGPSRVMSARSFIVPWARTTVQTVAPRQNLRSARMPGEMDDYGRDHLRGCGNASVFSWLPSAEEPVRNGRLDFIWRRFYQVVSDNQPCRVCDRDEPHNLSAHHSRVPDFPAVT